MLTLVQRSECPPGGFRYLIPETNTWIPNPKAHGATSFTSYAELREHVSQFYRGNAITPPADLEALMQDQVCRSIPDSYCADSTGRPLKGGGSLLSRIAAFTVGPLLQGTMTLLDHILGGRETVSLEESQRRAAICLTCPQHGLPDGCTGCSSKGLHALVKTIVGGKPAIFEPPITSCRVCGCMLEAAVRVKLPVLLRNISPEQMERYPAICWKRGPELE